MVTRYRAWMGEEALEDIDPSIIIIDISEDAPQEVVTTEARPGGGMYLTGQLRQSITVTIAVEIHEANTIHRQLVLSKIMRWGSGGQYLHTSYRPEQRLYIDSIEAASVSALKWTDTLEIKLTAYQRPWWEEATVSKMETVEASKSGILTVFNRGEMPCPLEAVFVAIDPLTNVAISCGSEKIVLTNISVKTGEEIRIAHDDNGIQQITAAGTSAMGNRNGQSADEITLKPGINKVSFSGDGLLSLTVTARGRKY